MPIDLTRADEFMAGHARVLDRRRFDLLLGDGSPDAVLAALDAYRNPDGGYGWGLEPDLRGRGSQPIHALHVFEVLADCGPAAGARGVALCDWLAGVMCDDGGLPFVLPILEPAATAPWFSGAEPGQSSLHGTAAVVSAAARLAASDAAVAAHPWLRRAIDHCLTQMGKAERLSAYETMFGLRLLDAVAESRSEAAGLLTRLVAEIPPSGALPVEGGIEGEALRPLDYSPEPSTATRRHLTSAVVAADLQRLASGQLDDGGWDVDFIPVSPASRVEWRGYATLRAVTVLNDHGLLR